MLAGLGRLVVLRVLLLRALAVDVAVRADDAVDLVDDVGDPEGVVGVEGHPRGLVVVVVRLELTSVVLVRLGRDAVLGYELTVSPQRETDRLTPEAFHE